MLALHGKPLNEGENVSKYQEHKFVGKLYRTPVALSEVFSPSCCLHGSNFMYHLHQGDLSKHTCHPHQGNLSNLCHLLDDLPKYTCDIHQEYLHVPSTLGQSFQSFLPFTPVPFSQSYVISTSASTGTPPWIPLKCYSPYQKRYPHSS